VSTTPITVALADDQPLVRSGLRMIVEGEPDLCVVGEAGDGAAAVALVVDKAPDVLLLDVQMPGVDGLEAMEQIAQAGATTRVLMLTTFDLDEYVYDALSSGASGFLLKDVAAERLFDAVRVVAAGDALLAPAVTRRLIGEFARLRPRLAPRTERLRELTARETEVLRLVAEGLSNGEIAERLFVSDETVKTHVSRVLMKLELRDRTQAVVAAYESGLVVPRK
jgi:DNA-binding NarL/FixJ family response regulator